MNHMFVHIPQVSAISQIITVTLSFTSPTRTVSSFASSCFFDCLLRKATSQPMCSATNVARLDCAVSGATMTAYKRISARGYQNCCTFVFCVFFVMYLIIRGSAYILSSGISKNPCICTALHRSEYQKQTMVEFDLAKGLPLSFTYYASVSPRPK